MTASELVRLYSVSAEDSIIEPRSYADVERLHEVVVSILRKYIDKYYRVQRERWDSENMIFTEIDAGDTNFQDYTLKISRDVRPPTSRTTRRNCMNACRNLPGKSVSAAITGT